MSIDDQREQYEIDNVSSMILNSAARALEETAETEIQNTVCNQYFFAPSMSEQSFPDGFQHEPGLHGMEVSQHDLSFNDLEGGILPQHVQGETAAETSDEQVFRSDYNRFLCDARRSSMSVVESKMPGDTWFFKQFLDSVEEFVFTSAVPAVPLEHLVPVATSGAESLEPCGISGKPTAESLVYAAVSMPMYSFAIKVVLDRDLFMEEAALWEKAVRKWLHVFDFLGSPSMLGHALLSEQVTSLGGAQSVVLHDASGIKSPRTAIKRAQTLLVYFSRLQPNGQDWEPFFCSNALIALARSLCKYLLAV